MGRGRIGSALAALAMLLLAAGCAGGAAPTASIDVAVSASPSASPPTPPPEWAAPTAPPLRTVTSGWAAEPTEAPDDFPGSGSPQTVSAPLLLYHHVRAETPIVRYAVSAQRFAQELDLLLEHHYHTITMQDLVSAVRYGTALPDRPVMLTFDDGNQDVLDMAFPLMQSRGMVGVVYVVGDRIGVEGFLSAAGLQRLRRAGWEIGSHGRTHRALDELTADELLDEVAHSKQVIETALGEPIYSFAYPFGIVTEASLLAVIRAGYTSGAGLGLVNAHRPDGLFYLSRREVRGTFELPSFEALLSPP